MPSIAVNVDDDLKDRMEQHPEITDRINESAHDRVESESE